MAKLTETQLSALKREWDLNQPNQDGVPLQDEFGGDYENYEAYCRHEAAGDITVCGSRAVTPARPRLAARRDADLVAAWRANPRISGGRRLQDVFGGKLSAFRAFAGAQTGEPRRALRAPSDQELRAEWDAYEADADGIRPQDEFESFEDFRDWKRAEAAGASVCRGPSNSAA